MDTGSLYLALAEKDSYDCINKVSKNNYIRARKFSTWHTAV